jgi:hypothetical protein
MSPSAWPTATVTQPDTTLRSVEVVVFPDNLRGTAEGHYPWDLGSSSMMTNATVANAVKAVDGQTVTVTYKGGEKKIDIPANVPVVALVRQARTTLRPVPVFVPAERQSDGSLHAGAVLFGKDGVIPPMVALRIWRQYPVAALPAEHRDLQRRVSTFQQVRLPVSRLTSMSRTRVDVFTSLILGVTVPLLQPTFEVVALAAVRSSSVSFVHFSLTLPLTYFPIPFNTVPFHGDILRVTKMRRRLNCRQVPSRRFTP